MEEGRLAVGRGKAGGGLGEGRVVPKGWRSMKLAFVARSCVQSVLACLHALQHRELAPGSIKNLHQTWPTSQCPPCAAALLTLTKIMISWCLQESINIWWINEALSNLGLSPIPNSPCNPVSEAVFNFVLAWAGMFLPVILTDGPSQKVEKKVGVQLVSSIPQRACVTRVPCVHLYSC